MEKIGTEHPDIDDISLQGTLKKLKTMKKKYFVLREESTTGPARLEYYDSEKKYINNLGPKRSIILKECFNINKKCDTKHKHAIAFYTKEDCFSIQCDNVEDQEKWLMVLLELQGTSELDGTPRSQFEHVWQVTVKPKGLGSSKNLSGAYRLCLTNTSLSLIRMNSDVAHLTFQFAAIRRCGHTESFFYMEVGRSATTGEGELWMQVEDVIIAQSMHEAIIRTMTLTTQDMNLRPRVSSTASDKSRPISHKTGYGSAEKPKRSQTISEGHGGRKINKYSPKPHRQDKRPSTMYTDPYKLGHSPINSHSSLLTDLQEQRLRSGSTDSRGTSSSVSTDDCDSGSDHKSGTRSVTPEAQYRDKTDYITMSPAISLASSPTVEPGMSYMDMNCSRPASSNSVEHKEANIDGYMSMTPSGVSGRVQDPEYLDMAPLSHTLPTVQENKASSDGYMEMSTGHSPQGTLPRPAKQHSYLQDPYEFPKRAYSVGSKPVRTTSIRQPTHVEEVSSHGKLDYSKSNSAPHLIPDVVRVQTEPNSPEIARRGSTPPKSADFLMEMDFNHRHRTSSDCYNYNRPRTASWGTSVRPRSGSHGTKKQQSKSKESLKKLSNESLKSDSQNSLNKMKGYMEMSPVARSLTPDRQLYKPTASIPSSDYTVMNPVSSNGTQSKKHKSKTEKKPISQLAVPKMSLKESSSPGSSGNSSPVASTHNIPMHTQHSLDLDFIPDGSGKYDAYMLFDPSKKSDSKDKKHTKDKKHKESKSHHHHHQHNHGGRKHSVVENPKTLAAATHSQTSGFKPVQMHGRKSEPSQHSPVNVNMHSRTHSEPNSDSYMLFQPGSSCDSVVHTSDSSNQSVHSSTDSTSDNHQAADLSDSYLLFSPGGTTSEVQQQKDNATEDSYLLFNPGVNIVESTTPSLALQKAKSYIKQESHITLSLPAKPKKSPITTATDKAFKKMPVLTQSSSSGNLENKNVDLLIAGDRHSMSDINDSTVQFLDKKLSNSTRYKSSNQTELNYASLDLNSADDVSGSCSSIGRHSSTGESDNNDTQLRYAEIDFTKSEGIKTESIRTSPGRGQQPSFSFEKKN